jgi:hypothetical protein
MNTKFFLHNTIIKRFINYKNVKTVKDPSIDICESIKKCLDNSHNTDKIFYRITNRYSIFKKSKVDTYVSFYPNFLFNCNEFQSIQKELYNNNIKLSIDNFHSTTTHKGYEVFYDIKNNEINIRV